MTRSILARGHFVYITGKSCFGKLNCFIENRAKNTQYYITLVAYIQREK